MLFFFTNHFSDSWHAMWLILRRVYIVGFVFSERIFAKFKFLLGKHHNFGPLSIHDKRLSPEALLDPIEVVRIELVLVDCGKSLVFVDMVLLALRFLVEGLRLFHIFRRILKNLLKSVDRLQRGIDSV